MAQPVLITRKALALAAAERWEETYRGGGPAGVGERLKALHDPTPEEVEEIIGNKTWTTQKCNGCGVVDAPSVVRLGEVPNYDSYTCYLCIPCLTSAYAKFRYD